MQNINVHEIMYSMPSTTSRKVKLSELSLLGSMKGKLGKLGIVSRDMFEKNVI